MSFPPPDDLRPSQQRHDPSRPSLPRPAAMREAPASFLRLGARLAAHRKAAGLGIEPLCRATRLSRQVVEAIEADDWDALPGDFYARGFIKLYAEAVRMDPEVALEAYDARVARLVEPERDEPIEPGWMRDANASRSRGPSPAQLFLLIVTVATIVVFMLGVQRSKRPQQVAGKPQVTAPSSGATALGGTQHEPADAHGADATPR
ncbi:MAG: helix-turn-helix domain-containing protein [Deltaproteobacteria bacterium]|nr:helix-turn-helix domain-containing protein [Deltaproteobacteria bacterium]